MGQIILLVVAAAWAAVLVPPLLRSRVENRPNSSVSDFRSQLSSLQRAMPGRGVTVRTMGRSLAPSTLVRPAAAGRPPLRSGLGSSHAARATQQPAGRQGAREASRIHESPARPRRHGDRPPTRPAAPGQRHVPDRAEIERRRTKVLYLVLATAVVTGLMAATTDSKAMVYLFAVAVIALGGYVYLLAMINQREADAALYVDDGRDPYDEPVRRSRPPSRARYDDAPGAPRSYRYDDDRDLYGDDTRYLSSRGYDDDTRFDDRSNLRATASDDTPGMGTTGRISYGRRPTTRYTGDAYGFETYDRPEPVRRPPARNGRHPTGQHPAVQRPREPQPVRRGYFPQAG